MGWAGGWGAGMGAMGHWGRCGYSTGKGLPTLRSTHGLGGTQECQYPPCERRSPDSLRFVCDPRGGDMTCQGGPGALPTMVSTKPPLPPPSLAPILGGTTPLSGPSPPALWVMWGYGPYFGVTVPASKAVPNLGGVYNPQFRGHYPPRSCPLGGAPPQFWGTHHTSTVMPIVGGHHPDFGEITPQR